MQGSVFNVSFVIPTLDEELHLQKLLDSIKALQQSEQIQVVETIVVDSRSTDSTVAIAKQNGCVVLVVEPGAVARSRNRGASIANGNLLAFIDADCELPTFWLLSIAQELSNKNTIAAGSIMAANPQSESWVEKAWYLLAHQTSNSNKADDVDWLATFNLAITKKAFELVGGFNESLSTCEDTEFGYRASMLGQLRRCNDSGVVHHGESKSLGEFFRREAWHARGSLTLLSTQWTNPRELISFLLPFLVISALVVALVGMVTITYTAPDQPILWLMLVSIPVIIPIIVLVLRRKIPISWFLPCASLLVVYFCARLRGTVSSSNRVERDEAVAERIS